MASLYDYMVRRLLQSNLHNDVEGIIEVEGLLNNIAMRGNKLTHRLLLIRTCVDD
jgi:flagellar biosynthetic protein FliS